MSPVWLVTVARVMVSLVAGLATVWCQCGQSVDTEDRGPGARDPASVRAMYGPDPGLSCGAVVVMLSGH